MSKVKDIARQLVEALPEEADFSDLDEFIWERAEVESGREDFEQGRTCSFEEVFSAVNGVGTSRQLRLSKHAVDSFNEFIEALKSLPEAPSGSVESVVAKALQTVTESPEAGVNLPEMGDTSVLEFHVWLPRAYRIVYDVHTRL